MDSTPQTKLDFLEEVRRIAQWGLSYSTDPYDVERYTRLLELAATEYEALGGVPSDVLIERFRAELGGNITPKVGVDGAIFDEEGRLLLIRRHDDKLMALPGGWAELGETPEASVAREVLEETGVEVEVGPLIGHYARMPGEFGQPHTSYHLIFHCRVVSGTPRTTPEALEIGYYDSQSVTDWHRDMAKVTEMCRDWWGHNMAALHTWVGVDGCRAGWFAVGMTPRGEAGAYLSPDIETLWEDWRQAQQILIDIPIGFRDDGKGARQCDHLARKALAPRRSVSVFPAPCRAALNRSTYEDASAVNEEKLGRRLSKQTWNIMPKMAEVDAFLQQNRAAREVVREVHPEVMLWSLNGGRPMDNPKRSEQGYRERVDLLGRYWPRAEAFMEETRGRYRMKDVALDDMVDALAIAVGAYAARGNLVSLPPDPEVDGKGLPMQMLHAPVEQ